MPELQRSVVLFDSWLRLTESTDSGLGLGSVFDELRCVLVSSSPGNADELAQELRALGSLVVVCGPEGDGLARAALLDPHVVLVDESPDSASSARWERLRREPALRGARAVRFRWGHLRRSQRGPLELDLLAMRLAPVMETHHVLWRSAAAGRGFETSLERIGSMGTLVRLIAGGAGTLRASIASADANAEIVAIDGLVVAARFAPFERDAVHGFAALAAALEIQSASVVVERLERVSEANVVLPVDEAIAMARTAGRDAPGRVADDALGHVVELGRPTPHVKLRTTVHDGRRRSSRPAPSRDEIARLLRGLDASDDADTQPGPAASHRPRPESGMQLRGRRESAIPTLPGIEDVSRELDLDAPIEAQPTRRVRALSDLQPSEHARTVPGAPELASSELASSERALTQLALAETELADVAAADAAREDPALANTVLANTVPASADALRGRAARGDETAQHAAVSSSIAPLASAAEAARGDTTTRRYVPEPRGDDDATLPRRSPSDEEATYRGARGASRAMGWRARSVPRAIAAGLTSLRESARALDPRARAAVALGAGAVASVIAPALVTALMLVAVRAVGTGAPEPSASAESLGAAAGATGERTAAASETLARSGPPRIAAERAREARAAGEAERRALAERRARERRAQAERRAEAERAAAASQRAEASAEAVTQAAAEPARPRRARARGMRYLEPSAVDAEAGPADPAGRRRRSDALVGEGRRRLDAGDKAGAEAAFLDAYSAASFNPHPAFALARLYAAERRTVLARAWVDRAIALRPNRASYRALRRQLAP